MIAQIIGAFARAFLVMVFIATPSLLLTAVPADTTQIVVLVAVCVGVMTFFEYTATYPGLVEFRDAPPFNRIRFGSMFICVFILTGVWRGETDPNVTSMFAKAVSLLIGQLLDFPYSPVHLFALMQHENADSAQFALVRASAGLAYLISIIAVSLFSVLIRVNQWPMRNGTFNVWINLPTFDPTASADVVAQLRRTAWINMSLGFLLPFLFPAVVVALRGFFTPFMLTNPQTVIWVVTGWALLPSSLVMRGLAINRIAYLIDAQRRAAAPDGEPGLLPV